MRSVTKSTIPKKAPTTIEIDVGFAGAPAATLAIQLCPDKATNADLWGSKYVLRWVQVAQTKVFRVYTFDHGSCYLYLIVSSNVAIQGKFNLDNLTVVSQEAPPAGVPEGMAGIMEMTTTMISL